jgi:hypothetical protein
VAPVNGRDVLDTEPLGTRHNRRINGSERQIPVTAHEIGDAQPIGGMNWLDIERTRGHVR